MYTWGGVKLVLSTPIKINTRLIINLNFRFQLSYDPSKIISFSMTLILKTHNLTIFKKNITRTIAGVNPIEIAHNQLPAFIPHNESKSARQDSQQR